MADYLTPGVYMEEFETCPKPIEGVKTSTVGFVGMAEKGNEDEPTLITSWHEFADKFGRYTANAPFLAPSVYGFFANGGMRCFVARLKDRATDQDYIGVDEGPGKKTGLQTFTKVDEIGTVCIPGVTLVTVQQALVAHCEYMKNRFCILDSHKNAGIADVLMQRENIVSEKGYGALYYPWVKVPVETQSALTNKVTIVEDIVPPSGYVAGIYARTDMERGVQKAPANEEIYEALGVGAIIGRSEQDTLTGKGINCIKKFPGKKVRVWGARTLSTDPERKYINVCRLLVYLEESIYKGTQWVVFEPNAEPLWAQIRLNVGAFMHNLFRQGSFQGSTPRDAYFVKCDKETTTQNGINLGIVNILVGFAPIKPAEFLIIKMQQMAGQIQA